MQMRLERLTKTGTLVPEGRIRQAQRMRHLSRWCCNGRKNCLRRLCLSPERARQEFAPDFTVWMNTIAEGRFEDTNKMFEDPCPCDYHVKEWFNDTYAQLLEVVKRYMEKHNV